MPRDLLASEPARGPRDLFARNPVVNPVAAGSNQGLTLGFGDEIYAGATAPIRALGGLFDGTGYDIGRAYDEGLENVRADNRQAETENPVAYATGDVVGSLGLGGAAAKTGVTFMNAAKPLVSSMLPRAAAEGAVYGGLSGFGREDGNLEDRMWAAADGALPGAIVGGALGGLGGALASRTASKAVPAVEDLKAEAGLLYEIAENSGVTFGPQTVKTLADDISAKVISEGIDPTLHPRANAALRRLQEQANVGMTVKEAQTLRRILSGAGKDPMNPDEGRIVGIMLDEFDNLVSKAAPELTEARALYHSAKKGELIETAINIAQDEASRTGGSIDRTLRNEFGKIARMIQKGQLKGLTDDEIAAIRKVALGGPIQNIMRLIGKAAPSGIVSTGLSTGVPFAIANTFGGPVAGATAAVATPAVGLLAKTASEAMTTAAARAASETVRRGGSAAVQQALTPEQIRTLRALIASGGNQGAQVPFALPATAPVAR